MMKDNGLALAGPSEDDYKIKTKRVLKTITNVATSNQITIPRKIGDSSYCNNLKLLINAALQQTLSMKIVLLDLGGWPKPKRHRIHYLWLQLRWRQFLKLV